MRTNATPASRAASTMPSRALPGCSASPSSAPRSPAATTGSICQATASRWRSRPPSSPSAAQSALPESGTELVRDAAEIVFDHVTKRYAGRNEAALDDLSLEIPAGTFCVLVGPSGGGKTTALKMVNRLIPFDLGDIRIDGRSVSDLPLVELRRGIGYVIQQIGLFPHMTVGENIATVPSLLRWGHKRQSERTTALAAP